MSQPIAVLIFIAQLASAGSSTVNLTVRLADGRSQFRPGETISIELEFSSAVPKRFAVDGATYDRSGRLTIDDFIIEPMDDVSDPTSVDTSKATICGQSKPTISWRPRLGSFTSARPRCASPSALWCASFAART